MFWGRLNYNRGYQIKGGGSVAAQPDYIIEMLHITKEFPGIIANDDIKIGRAHV